jgi:3'(2'), 5'-bisphosphate nucleotidase
MRSNCLDHKVVFDIIRTAGDILLHHHKTHLDVAYKVDEFDPVTIADQESDHFLRSELQKIFPDDFIISEEGLHSQTTYQGRTWFIDPLDGTKDFLKGRNCFAINIGLLEKDQPIFGCVYIPARQQLFYGERHSGAFQDRGGRIERIYASPIQAIRDARLITRHPSEEVRPIEDLIDCLPFKERFPEGSIGTKLCLIASGQAEVHINTNFKASKWDTLAPGLILTEAGGTITDFDGQELDYTQMSPVWGRSFIASNNKNIHTDIIERMRT